MIDVKEFFAGIFSEPPSILHQNYVLIGGFILLFGLVSLFVKERLYLTESLVATLVGVAFGPLGLRIVVPREWFASSSGISGFYGGISEAGRLIMGLQIMATAVSVPRGWVGKNWKTLAIMLGPVMGFSWAISAALIHLTLRLPWLEALIVSACIAPTDPVLAHSVIKGKFAERYIPTRLRNLLAVESGANDGLGFPFLMLPIWLILQPSVSSALEHWFLHTWLWEICGSIALGFVCGLLARHLLKMSMAKRLIDKESFLVFTIALTLFVSGVVALMASDDLFAIFVAGLTFAAWDATLSVAHEDSHISEVIDMLFNISFFVFFGASIPWADFYAFGLGRLFLCAAVILLFRRLPIVMILRPWIASLQSRKEAFLAGWFGPMGVGALFFAVQARSIFERHHRDMNIAMPPFLDDIFTIVCFVVLSSILIHGITVPLTNSHLKRRMRLKVKRRKQLAARLNELASTAMTELPEGEEASMTSGAGNSPILSPQSPTATDMTSTTAHTVTEEYIYITDDENLQLTGSAAAALIDSPIGPDDIVIHDGIAGQRQYLVTSTSLERLIKPEEEAAIRREHYINKSNHHHECDDNCLHSP